MKGGRNKLSDQTQEGKAKEHGKDTTRKGRKRETGRTHTTQDSRGVRIRGGRFRSQCSLTSYPSCLAGLTSEQPLAPLSSRFPLRRRRLLEDRLGCCDLRAVVTSEALVFLRVPCALCVLPPESVSCCSCSCCPRCCCFRPTDGGGPFALHWAVGCAQCPTGV
jgi:hypothetical protein